MKVVAAVVRVAPRLIIAVTSASSAMDTVDHASMSRMAAREPLQRPCQRRPGHHRVATERHRATPSLVAAQETDDPALGASAVTLALVRPRLRRARRALDGLFLQGRDVSVDAWRVRRSTKRTSSSLNDDRLPRAGAGNGRRGSGGRHQSRN